VSQVGRRRVRRAARGPWHEGAGPRAAGV